MKTFILLAAVATAVASPGYHFDAARYLFAAPGVEQSHRVQLMSDVDRFLAEPALSLNTPAALSQWLASYDSLSKRLNRHDVYVYLRAEANTDDHADETADEQLEAAITSMESKVQGVLEELGAGKLHAYLASDGSLAPRRYFMESMLARAAHRSRCASLCTLLVGPTLDNLTSSYRSLVNRMAVRSGHPSDTAAAEFAARWNPFVANEDRIASLLIPIIDLHQGEAKAQGFTDEPTAAYFGDHLTSREVDAALKAVRKSAGYKHYIAVLSTVASHRLHVAPTALHAWDLDRIDVYEPGRVALPDALRLILAAETPMGPAYAAQYARLFDPASGRLEWCRAATCDRTGFSVGYAGVISGLFYGSYTGDVDSMRAVAHEAGHAVHREFMAENQPLAMYNDGPKFMFESFAIFNEFLFLDHLYRTAPSPAARAYYLNRFLADATFQVWGSAKETDLEQSLYAAATRGKLHDAADLDALALKVLARYMPEPSLDPRMRVYWARDRLYFTDPAYDANYLFAGLLALEYLRRLDEEPAVFPARYVRLLENGFTDTPQALEKKFLGIDLDDTDGLVRNAAGLIERRVQTLGRLYDASQLPATGSHHGAGGTRAESPRTGA